MTSTLTRTQRMYDALRAEILQGDRPPGSALRIQELVDRYGVSMSVVREALIKLSAQHLVTSTPNMGFRVVDVSENDLRDLVDARVWIEGIAFRRSIERGDLAWEARVVSAHHVLEGTPMRADDVAGTTEEWIAAHAAFHRALESGCQSPRLLGFTRSLRDSAELYRQYSGSYEAPPRDVAGEHRELAQLAVARRVDDAVTLLERHIRLTAELLLDAGCLASHSDTSDSDTSRS